MALGPKQMGEAILRNLKEKTGKDIGEWLKIVESSGLADKKPIMNLLKTEHGVGHFQAQKIFEQFSNSDIYENSDLFIDQLFSTHDTKEKYISIERAIQKLGKDIRVQPCKTYIPFYRKNQFAVVTRNKSGEIILALNLPENFKNERFIQAKSLASERINFQTTLAPDEEIDSEILTIIKQAYFLN